jgi:hypothetical protein
MTPELAAWIVRQQQRVAEQQWRLARQQEYLHRALAGHEPADDV